ncbi:BrnA antitoxin family protein [Vineibacter terrae]|uniref:BrnA antitoxin family protein n=1 Tax=Vineibacter terrae TaxID=2586908 RepID=A0A5C8PS82_9HYPH|nr:BrnA antitoxin family protein [Vineibacter terrae]TXL79590.1 BrnA antitoxin family protein [Vineibacter terrae]
MSRKELSRSELDQLAKLAKLRNDQIDTIDIPEAPAENWMQARRGEFYRPRKQAVTIRLDADVVAWFKERADNGGYQTEINRALRRYVAAMVGQANRGVRRRG